jgi:hypothetical protein
VHIVIDDLETFARGDYGERLKRRRVAQLGMLSALLLDDSLDQRPPGSPRKVNRG